MIDNPPLATRTEGRPGRTRSLMYWQVRIFAITWIAYAAFYITRQAFAAAKLGILDDPDASTILTREMLGNIDAAYLIAYAVGQFVWGSVADKWGTRVVVLGGLLGSAVAALLMGVVPALILFLPLMIVQGLAQSSGWGPLLKNVSLFFSPSVRGRVIGFWSTTYVFGGLIGAPVAGWFAYSVFDSWRAAFVAAALIVTAVAVLFFVFQRNTPEDVGLSAAEPVDGEEGIPGSEAKKVVAVPARRGSAFRALLDAMRNRDVVRLGAVYFLLKPARYAILLWGPIIAIERIPSLDFLSATVLPVVFGIAGLAAPIVAGWVSDSVFGARRAPVAIIALGVTALALALFYPLTAGGSIWALALMFGALGFALYSADSVVSAVAAVDFGDDESAAASIGFVNGAGAIGAVLGGLLPGYFAGSTLFLFFGGATVVAALILLPSWNRRASDRSVLVEEVAR